MRSPRWMRLFLACVVALAWLGCGARSELLAPDVSEDAGPVADAGERLCLPNCFIGHECCLGGCDGPRVPTLNGCCTCLPGEVSTFDCDEVHCGGD
jgi:hypothetical protein